MKVAGDRIGRFRVERFLGAGGIAEVYQVRHELLDTSHALKLLPIARRGLAKRLIQEGRIQAQLQHPNVVSVTDVVEERGQIGLVMEYVEGTSLEELLREGGAMDFDEAMDLIIREVGGGGTDYGQAWQDLHDRPASSDELVDAQARWYHHAIACFGPGRCLFESNFPVDRRSLPYGVYWNAMKKIAARYSADEQQAMFHDNAERIYKL